MAVAALATAAIAFIGISVDAQRWRAPLAEVISRMLGREVRIDGPMRLIVSLQPAIVLGEIRIANAPGFDAPDFARIGELYIKTELLPLLREEIRVRDLHGRDVTVGLARTADGRGNWVFEPRATERAPGGPFELSRVDVHHATIKQATIEYVDGLCRLVDNRIAVQVERGIQYDAFAGNFLIMFDETVKIGVPFFCHFLRSNRMVVGMLPCHTLRTRFRARVERNDHVRRKHGLGLNIIVFSALRQNRWSKRHPKITIFNHVIDDAHRFHIISPSQDRSVA